MKPFECGYSISKTNNWSLRYYAILTIVEQEILVLEQELVAELVIHRCADRSAILFGQTFITKLLLQLFETFFVEMKLWIVIHTPNYNNVRLYIPLRSQLTFASNFFDRNGRTSWLTVFSIVDWLT